MRKKRHNKGWVKVLKQTNEIEWNLLAFNF